jgi:short-subunit dehydrogenase
MNIAITGHTKGLGAEFYKSYASEGHNILGFSRSNGYDLRDWSKMQNMLAQIQDFDLFINCAKPDFVQTTILYELWKRWKGQNKTIINISSVITYFPTCPPALFDCPNMDHYRTAKMSLNEASAQLSLKSVTPHIMLVKPAHLYDNPPTEQQLEKLSQWVQTIKNIINDTQKNNFKLYEITL